MQDSQYISSHNPLGMDQRIYDSICCEFTNDGYSDDFTRSKFKITVSYFGNTLESSFFMSAKEGMDRAKELFLKAVGDECALVENTDNIEDWAAELAFDLEVDRERYEALYERSVRQHEEWQDLLGENFMHFLYPRQFEADFTCIDDLSEQDGSAPRICP